MSWHHSTVFSLYRERCERGHLGCVHLHFMWINDAGFFLQVERVTRSEDSGLLDLVLEFLLIVGCCTLRIRIPHKTVGAFPAAWSRRFYRIMVIVYHTSVGETAGECPFLKT